MNQEEFGNIVYNGKLVNVDTEEIEILKEISLELENKNKKLEKKMECIFKQ